MNSILWDREKLTERENQFVGFMVSTRLEMHTLMINHNQWSHGTHTELDPAEKVTSDLRSYFPDLNFRLGEPTPGHIQQAVLNIPPWPTHCPQCKAEYEHIGHPLYPGATMMTVCKCKLVQTSDGNGGVIQTLVPPEAP
jgi:hypothetical protein